MTHSDPPDQLFGPDGANVGRKPSSTPEDGRVTSQGKRI
jgi:hypothetical protein